MIYLIWLIVAILFTFAWILRRYIFNAWYILCVIIDVLMDVACQVWIDLENVAKWVRRLFRRKRSADIEAYEEFWRD